MRLRDYVATDMPYLYDICLRTGDSGKDASALYRDKYMIGQYYAAPYAARDPRCALVLEGESDGIVRPLGYILGTPDTVAYNEWFDTNWRSGAAALYPGGLPGSSGHEARLRSLFAQPFPGEQPSWYREYPGQIHIDLLPEAQGAGWGSRLMDAFGLRLVSLGCPGFHLGVGKLNEGGVAFYRRYGMLELDAPDWGFYFGKRL